MSNDTLPETDYGKIIEKFVKGKANVIGWSHDLVPKQKKGKFLKTKKSIRVYVEKKVEISNLDIKNIIPSALEIGNETIDVDVVVIGKVKALDVLDRIRPICGGISAMSHYEDATACTLGYFGESTLPEEEGLVGIICNNHCGAKENTLPKGSPYTQPSKLDGGVLNTDVVAHLHRFVELKFVSFECRYRNALHKIYRAFNGIELNRCDNAFMTPIDVEYLKALYKIGEIKYKREARMGDIAMKCGRTTDLTKGAECIDVNATINVQYSRGFCMFEDVVIFQGEGFCAGGDSSSFIVLQDKPDTIINELFAGSDTSTIGIKLRNIEKELQVKLLAKWID